jgi:hypothetical protein
MHVGETSESVGCTKAKHRNRLKRFSKEMRLLFKNVILQDIIIKYHENGLGLGLWCLTPLLQLSGNCWH